MASKNRLSTKIILMVECILLISSTLFCTVSIYRARGAIRQAITQRMLDIANCASGSVNGDVLSDLEADDIGSDRYNKVYNSLTVFRDNVELEYVYALRQSGEHEYIFIMDTDPDSPASYGDSVEYTPALDMAGHGIAAVDDEAYSDQWGTFYSAYSPVFDSNGNVAGIVAADFSAEWFDGQLSEQTRSTVTYYIMILLLSLLVGAVISLLTVRPFVKLQGKLFEEKVRAETSDRAKTEFLARMSHEIRTPINAILGMNEMILRQDSDTDDALENVQSYASQIKSSGSTLMEMVNEMLDESGRLSRSDADKVKPGQHETFHAPTARILAVDDTKTNLLVLQHLLKRTQIHTDTASSGAESVEMAQKTRYDVILMDQRMPEMEGTEALHLIRATKGGASSDSPVICLTADAVAGAREHYLAEGFSEYMAKPVNSETLEKMILKFLPAEKVEHITSA